MLLTIALILAAMIAVAALELWLFWRAGERDDVDASVFVGIEAARPQCGDTHADAIPSASLAGRPSPPGEARRGLECQDNVGTVFGRSRLRPRNGGEAPRAHGRHAWRGRAGSHG